MMEKLAKRNVHTTFNDATSLAKATTTTTATYKRTHKKRKKK
jgi:hypothetical protein